MRKRHNTANERQPQASYIFYLLPFLLVSFIHISVPGTRLDLIQFKPAHPIPDYQTIFKNGTETRYPKTQSERKLRKFGGFQETEAIAYENHKEHFPNEENPAKEAFAIKELFQEGPAQSEAHQPTSHLRSLCKIRRRFTIRHV
jgi:hypothetical protein